MVTVTVMGNDPVWQAYQSHAEFLIITGRQATKEYLAGQRHLESRKEMGMTGDIME